MVKVTGQQHYHHIEEVLAPHASSWSQSALWIHFGCCDQGVDVFCVLCLLFDTYVSQESGMDSQYASTRASEASEVSLSVREGVQFVVTHICLCWLVPATDSKPWPHIALLEANLII